MYIGCLFCMHAELIEFVKDNRPCTKKRQCKQRTLHANSPTGKNGEFLSVRSFPSESIRFNYGGCNERLKAWYSTHEFEPSVRPRDAVPAKNEVGLGVSAECPEEKQRKCEKPAENNSTWHAAPQHFCCARHSLVVLPSFCLFWRTCWYIWGIAPSACPFHCISCAEHIGIFAVHKVKPLSQDGLGVESQ